MDNLIREVFYHSPESYALLEEQALGLVDCNAEFSRRFCPQNKSDQVGKNLFEILGWPEPKKNTEEDFEKEIQFGLSI